MEKYKKKIIEFIKNPKFIIPLIIVVIASFGYLSTHEFVNGDALTNDRYCDGDELIAQGRLFFPIVDRIFNIFDFYPFFLTLIFMLVLMFATILFCALFDIESNGKIKCIAYTVFACSFVSYPLAMEMYAGLTMRLGIAMGFCFIATSLILINETWKTNKIKSFIAGIILLWCAISSYEAFAVVYVMGVFLLLFVKQVFSDDKIKNLKQYFLLGFKFAIPLIIALMFNFVITRLVLIVFKVNVSIYPAKNIMYGELGLIGGIKNLFHTIMISYVINALGYMPMTILDVSCIISIIIGIVLTIKKKDAKIILTVFGMNLTLILLSILQGRAAYYRTCEHFPLFVSMIFLIVVQYLETAKLKKILKNTAFFFVFLVIFYQVKETYKWEYINYLKYEKEKNDMILLGNELEKNYDVENKPVIFIGEYELQDAVKRTITIKKDSLHYKVLDYYNKHFYDNKLDVDNYEITIDSMKSYIQWGKGAFLAEGEANAENIKFLKYHGYDFKVGTDSMYVNAIVLSRLNDLPRWPKEGSIVEMEDCIVVNF